MVSSFNVLPEMSSPVRMALGSGSFDFAPSPRDKAVDLAEAEFCAECVVVHMHRVVAPWRDGTALESQSPVRCPGRTPPLFGALRGAPVSGTLPLHSAANCLNGAALLVRPLPAVVEQDGNA